MSKDRAGLFALLGLTGLALGGAALASASSKREPRGEGRLAKDYPASKRRWDLVYSGTTPPDTLSPTPWFKTGDTVYYRVPTGESEGADPAIDQKRGYQVVNLSAYRLMLQQPDGNWLPDTERGTNWQYQLNATVGDPPEPMKVDQGWLSATPQVAPTVVKKVAAVLAPTATPAAAPVVKAQVAPVTAKQEAAMNLPLYPQGLIMSKDNTSGTVLGIKKTPDGAYSYQLRGARGMFSENYTVNEPQLVNKLAELAGQQAYGFAFPVGVTLLMKKLKLQIQGRQVKDGKMFYTTDALGEITEPQLIIKLYEAQKG
jgi:hypothetical protein